MLNVLTRAVSVLRGVIVTNQQPLEGILKKLEKQFQSDLLYDYFSAFHDVIVRGHSSIVDDNPHEPWENPSHLLYQAGAIAAEKLLSQLKDAANN